MALGSHARITSLDLGGNKLQMEDDVELAKCLGWIQVASISLERNKLDMRDISQLVASLQSINRLTRLVLRGNPFEHDGVADMHVESMGLELARSCPIRFIMMSATSDVCRCLLPRGGCTCPPTPLQRSMKKRTLFLCTSVNVALRCWFSLGLPHIDKGGGGLY